MRVPVLVYLILSQNFLHESLQKLILRLVAGLATAVQGFGRCALPRAAPTSGAERATGLWLRRA